MIGSTFSRSFRAGKRPLTITSANQLPNLEVWYYADVNTNLGAITSGSEVVAWNNAGGLTSHPWNSTGGKRPEWFSNIKNGLGVVRFDNNTVDVPTGEDSDTDESLSINPIAYLQSLAGATMVILYRSLSTAAGRRIATSTNTSGFQWGQNGTQYVGGFSGATFTVDTQTADTNFHHIILKFDGSQTTNATRLKARLDSSEVSLTFSGTVGATTSPSASSFYGGVDSTGNSNYFIGDIGEVIIFTRTLTLSEELAIEQYLTNKWAV